MPVFELELSMVDLAGGRTVMVNMEVLEVPGQLVHLNQSRDVITRVQSILSRVL